jgi:regulatory protein
MLHQKNVEAAALQEAFAQIDEDLYISILTEELKKKLKTIKDTDDYIVRGKLFQFAAGRGFEGELIHKMISKILKENE